MDKTSLYFHVPFCVRRCGYCDFNTFAGMNSYLSKYVDAVCQEQKMIAESSFKPIQVGTIFFGGGTPSLLSVEHYHQLLSTTKEYFDLQPDIEITIEANPGTVTENYLERLHQTGVNRISFGMQSAHPDDLRILDRQHHHEDVIRAVKWSKKVGFQHINLDLIFGIPGQNMSRWNNSLEMALMENIDHFSLYSLSIEEGTPMKKWMEQGRLEVIDDELSAEMYELAMDKLENAGFLQYEISNWAKISQVDNRCQHNLQYWRYLPYLGLGAGAHGFMCGIRTENVGGIIDYINAVSQDPSKTFPGGPVCKQPVALSKWDMMQEFMMVGFRLAEEGVSRNEFQTRFGFNLDELFDRQISLLSRQGLIEIHPQNSDRLRLTIKGRLFGNQVFSKFVGNREPDLVKIKDN